MRGSETSLGQGRVHRYLWVRETFFGLSVMSFGQKTPNVRPNKDRTRHAGMALVPADPVICHISVGDPRTDRWGCKVPYLLTDKWGSMYLNG